MSSKTRSSLLSLTIIAVLVFSALGTTTAYADGDPPPDTPPPETSTSVDEASVATASTADPTIADKVTDSTDATPEVKSTPDPVIADVADDSSAASVDATSAPVEATKEAGSEEAATPVTEQAAQDSSILDEVPADTTVTVLDANGKSQPLATQQAADAIATSDPIWCPAGQSPIPGANGCTGSFASFDLLLTALAADPTTYHGAGTIFVEQGAYQGNDPNNTINFDNYNLSNISGSDLTIMGGWDIAAGTTNSVSTFNNTSVIIGSTNPWGGSLTLANLTMNFATQTTAPAVPVNGLTLSSAGGITLVNVSVTNAPSAGADLGAGGDVTIVNSHFDRNQTTGATIRQANNVNIVSASFDNPINARRQDTGLDVQNAATVALINVTASNERFAGAHINASGAVSITSSVFSGTKVIQGADFLGYGLQVTTPGTIDLDNVTANDNFLYGATLDTSSGTGAIAIVNSTFNANTTASPGFIDDTGLVVHGGSTVALTNVIADNNRLFGATIDANGTVDVNGGSFSNNRGTITTGGVATDNGIGLRVVTPAGIHLDGVTANNNMLFGAQLTSGADVTVGFSQFNNNGGGPAGTGTGLDILGATDVSLFNVTATGNALDGVAVQTSCTSVEGGTFTGNGQHGLNLGSSALDLISPPTGDIFPATPASCSLLLLSGGNTTASAGASNVFASLQVASPSIASALSNVRSGSVSRKTMSAGSLTLNSFLANMKTSTGGTHLSLFTGKYAYIYSSTGMQVIAFAPSFNGLAMDGS